jgi:trehalose 6-phosphate phosphatase
MTSPPRRLAEALTACAKAGTLLVATDFDGVLAPLVQDPLQSRALPGTVETLEDLAALPSTHAAVVSGRDLDTLTSLTGLESSSVTRIGSHGAESSGDDVAAAAGKLEDHQAATLDALVADLAPVVAAHPGSGLEHKPSAVVLHTRGMADGAAAPAEAAALEVAARHTEVHVLHGKHVVEISVVKADKGTALMRLRDAVGADCVVYFGDDVTDEDVFRLLSDHDLGVKVGDGETAARHRVAGPEDVASVLADLLKTRQTH